MNINTTVQTGLCLALIANITACSDSGTRWKCRHQGVIENTWATSGTGAYSMALTPVADSGSGCGNGASQRIDFWLTTESFAAYGA
jgi:hypothetical protein